jgi:acyl-ACP thioesterase
MLLGWGNDAFTKSIERNRMIMTKEELLEELRYRICEVTFTKVNGETRTMPCTLRPDLVPAYERKTPVKEATEKESATLSVWCIDKQAWRSFRVDSVTDFKINLELHGF